MMSESSRRPGPLDAPPRRLRRAKGEMTVYPNGAHAAATTNLGGESAAAAGEGEAATAAAAIKEAPAAAEVAGAEVQGRQAETVTVGPGSGGAATSDDAIGDVSTVAVDQAIAAADEPRFRIFIIDTGWNQVARNVLQKHLAIFRGLMGGDPIYVLDQDMSLAHLRRNHEQIGRDPIIYVHDMRAIRHGRTGGVHGVRLHLGLMRDANKAKRALTMLVRFLARFRMSDDFEFQVHRRLHLDGLVGAITIMGGRTPHRTLLNE
jgi:hypothetical protein